MTDPVKVLSDDEVARIQKQNQYDGGLIISPEIDALCATVGALRVELERIPLAQSALRQLDELQAANQRALAENTALRDQLAQVTQER